MSQAKLIDEIKNLSKEKVLQMDDKDVKELRNRLLTARSKLNPFSVKVKGCDEGELLFSAVNMQREYEVKLITTAMVGFLRRAANEWEVPPNVPVVDVVDYLRDPTLIDPIESVDGRKLPPDELESYELNKKMMLKRIVVCEFLEYLFGYDPDKHARPGYKPNFTDNERLPVLTPAAEVAVLLEKRRITKSKTSNVVEKEEASRLYDLYMEEKKKASEGVVLEKPFTRKIVRTIKSKNGEVMKVERNIKCTETEYKLAQLKLDDPNDPDNLKVLQSDHKVIPVGSADYNDYFERRNQAQDQALHDVVRSLIPPADMFHRFNVYLEKHYEQLIRATRDLYHEKPDYDMAILPYKALKPKLDKDGRMLSTLKQAEDFKTKNSKDLKMSARLAQFGKWTILAAYKQNRDAERHFDESSILGEIIKSNVAGQTLAKDMMDKTATIKRKKLEAIHGKKSDDFEKNYGQLADGVSKFGVDKISEEEEDELLREADALLINVLTIKNGGRDVQPGKIYTQAEAPEHMIRK